MFDDDAIDRRTFVRASAAALGGVTLAGCGGGSGDGNGGGEGTPRSFGGWMEEVDNYDGVVDETGADGVTVMVGTEANGGNFGFGPPAIEISTGTTVTWEWTGKGGQHNVAAEDGSFESELVAEAGHTFEHTFESTGTVKYACTPHESLGMKGVVVVV